ncbi:MAG: GTPase [Rickettsiaceae bacterium]|nr:GTPase [Rickettsiaceae bacterium]
MQKDILEAIVNQNSYQIGLTAQNEVAQILAFIYEELEKASSYIRKLNTKENAVFVIGKTGTGKSTLINYLSGKQMIASQTNTGKWILEPINPLEDMTVSSDNTSPNTYQVSAYTPKGKEYSYIDTPGFVFVSIADHRNIAEAYFRWKVFDKIKNIKIIEVLSFDYFDSSNNRGDIKQNILSALQTFASQGDKTHSEQGIEVTTVPEDEIIKSISNSSIIVVTSVPKGEDQLREIDNLVEQRAKKEIELTEARAEERTSAFARRMVDSLRSEIEVLNTKIEQGQQEHEVQKSGIHNIINVTLSKLAAQNQEAPIRTFIENLNHNNEQNAHIRFFSRHETAGPIEIGVPYEHLDRTKIYDLIENNNIVPWCPISSMNIRSVVSRNTLDYTQCFVNVLNDIIEYITKDKICTNIVAACRTNISQASSWGDLKNYLETLNNTIEEVTTQLSEENHRFSQILAGSFQSNQLLHILDEDSLNQITTTIEKLEFCKAIRTPEGIVIDGIIFDVAKYISPIQALKEFITANLISTNNSSYDNGNLIIKGILVPLSYVNEKIQESEQNLRSTIKSIKIISPNTVFFNEDLKYTKPKDGIKVDIISPRWVVETLHKTPWITSYAYSESKDTNGIVLDLSGLDGKDFEKEYKKAKSGNHGTEDHRDGGIGEDGKPGERGGNGGHFFGVGTEFTNLSSLKVNVSGGNGVKGQDGGDGGNGFRGEDGDRQSVDERKSSVTREYIREKSGANAIFHATYESKSADPGKGGDGGMGGSGGACGKAGTCYMFSGLSIDKITYIGQDGNSGETGIAGRGGKRGEGGTSFSRKYHEEWPLVNISMNLADKYGPTVGTAVPVIAGDATAGAAIIATDAAVGGSVSSALAAAGISFGAATSGVAVVGLGTLCVYSILNSGWIDKKCIKTRCPDGKDGESPLEKTPFDEIQALEEYDDPVIRDDNSLYKALNEYSEQSKDSELLGEFFGEFCIDSFEH